MADLVDSYSETNQNEQANLRDHHPSDSTYSSAWGQSFTCTVSKMIVEAKFYLKKLGSPTGNGHAALYAHSGVYGSSSVLTGAPLAISNDFDVSSLTTSYVLRTFIFSGAQQYTMEDVTYYCILFQNPAAGTIDTGNYIIVGLDISVPMHDGNGVFYQNGSAGYNAAVDACFYVYGETPVVVPANPLIGKPLISSDMVRKAKIR